MAARVFLVPIDLAQNELQNAVIQNLASFPGSPLAGQVVFRTSDNTHYGYDGTTWHSFYGGAGAVTSVTAADGTVTITPTTGAVTVKVTAGGLDHTYISDFDTQVRTSRLDQMAAPTASVSFNGQKITNLADPTSAQDAATKAYVDSLSQGLDFKNSVVVATTANVTLSGEQTIDGVLTSTSRILVKNQSTGSENGIWVTAAGAWARAADADTSGEISKGTIVYVESGTTQSGQLWVCSNTSATPWVPGSSTSTWVQFAGAADITATAPITKTGNAIGISLGNGVTTSGGSLVVDTAVVVRKFAQLIGNGSSTSITVTHNLGTQDITASVRNASTNAFVDCDIVSTSTTQATFNFTTAPANNAYRVVIHG